MPFPTQVPLEYAEWAIKALPTRIVGCYGIANSQNVIVYVGQSTDVRERLLQHIQGNSDNPLINRSNPSRIFFLVCLTWQLDEVESSLIREYRPACNRAG